MSTPRLAKAAEEHQGGVAVPSEAEEKDNSGALSETTVPSEPPEDETVCSPSHVYVYRILHTFYVFASVYAPKE